MRSSIQKLFIVIIFMYFTIKIYAQDPQLSQFYASPIYTNPAFAGAAKKIRFSANARNQYTALNKTYRTVVTSFDAYVPKMKSGLGLMVSADQAGDGYLTTTNIGGVYAYNLQINRKWNANFGILAEIRQRSYDFSKFTFGDQLDPVDGVVRQTSEVAGLPQKMFQNFSAGALIYSEFFYAGFATNNLFEPNQSFISVDNNGQAFILPRRYTAHAGANIPLNKTRYEADKIYLSPNILFMKQRDFYQVNLGTYIKKQALTVGIWYRQTSRNADAIIFLAGMRFKTFRIGYSYDLTISNARTATVGSHEISIGFDINTNQRPRSKMGKPIPCPDL